MTLKIEILHFFEDQKELEEVFIKNLFDYNLSIGKCLLTISWSELGIKSVDTLLYTSSTDLCNFLSKTSWWIREVQR